MSICIHWARAQWVASTPAPESVVRRIAACGLATPRMVTVAGSRRRGYRDPRFTHRAAPLNSPGRTAGRVKLSLDRVAPGRLTTV